MGSTQGGRRLSTARRDGAMWRCALSPHCAPRPRAAQLRSLPTRPMISRAALPTRPSPLRPPAPHAFQPGARRSTSRCRNHNHNHNHNHRRNFRAAAAGRNCCPCCCRCDMPQSTANGGATGSRPVSFAIRFAGPPPRHTALRSTCPSSKPLASWLTPLAPGARVPLQQSKDVLLDSESLSKALLEGSDGLPFTEDMRLEADASIEETGNGLNPTGRNCLQRVAGGDTAELATVRRPGTVDSRQACGPASRRACNGCICSRGSAWVHAWPSTWGWATIQVQATPDVSRRLK